ncbi:hypothetical protein FM106_28165 [Brachybacterium faecium]|nr:hypothetical protein FM106_28165 [Brachybacterium faecium]
MHRHAFLSPPTPLAPTVGFSRGDGIWGGAAAALHSRCPA